MRALFPRFVEAEAANGSVIRALRKMQGPRNADGAFRSFPRGLDEIIEGLMRAVPKESVRLNSTVARVDAARGVFTMHLEDRPPIHAGAVILACPAFSTADLVRAIDVRLADLCGSIAYLSTATVVLAFPREAVHHPLGGTGFVVPKSEGLNITAGAWISSKWPHRAPPSHALLRAFLGGARDPNVLAKNDRELTEIALNELGKILGIRGSPTFTRVYRWNRASPQLEVGHLELVAKIDAQLAHHPGLFVSAAGVRGVGIPDCIADARTTAGMAADYVKHH